MAKKKHNDSFWTSYSDLMTSLFFVMLVLFIVCLVKVNGINQDLKKANSDANAKIEEYERILQLKEQFEVLTKATILDYDQEKKMFYAKDFQEKEIFAPFTGANMEQATTIKTEYLQTVDKVGNDLIKILEKLNSNKQFSYQLVIEGNAAIPWQQLHNGNFNPDNATMYDLSYRRALALYNRWRSKGLNFRQYNTEIIIAGSGFNGNNRDTKIEDYNKRFVIQIIPKIDRPEIER